MNKLYFLISFKKVTRNTHLTDSTLKKQNSSRFIHYLTAKEFRLIMFLTIFIILLVKCCLSVLCFL